MPTNHSLLGFDATPEGSFLPWLRISLVIFDVSPGGREFATGCYYSAIFEMLF